MGEKILGLQNLRISQELPTPNQFIYLYGDKNYLMILSSILAAKQAGKKQLAVLVDPDKTSDQHLEQLIRTALMAKVDYFFIGGSLLMSDRLEPCLEQIGRACSIPRILFPGNALMVHPGADGILLLSLISGRNPEFLIGQHVIAAPSLKKSGLEIIPTSYLLIDGGAPTSVTYMSNTTPIPADKADIAQCTAMAGEMLGHQLVYLDAGSGARRPIPVATIQAVSQNVDIPLIIGGGIRNPEAALHATRAGADLIVVGTASEYDPMILVEMAEAIRFSTVEDGRATVDGRRSMVDE
ncbi:MAG: geranylgeranylglyceryl/heptaprenylglyceryl phosphate synthase [Saprospiraceae bacterium]